MRKKISVQKVGFINGNLKLPRGIFEILKNYFYLEWRYRIWEKCLQSNWKVKAGRHLINLVSQKCWIEIILLNNRADISAGKREANITYCPKVFSKFILSSQIVHDTSQISREFEVESCSTDVTQVLSIIDLHISYLRLNLAKTWMILVRNRIEYKICLSKTHYFVEEIFDDRLTFAPGSYTSGA